MEGGLSSRRALYSAASCKRTVVRRVTGVVGRDCVLMGYNSSCSKHRCHCVDDLLAPLRNKMKVLKKFKRRMGLG